TTPTRASRGRGSPARPTLRSGGSTGVCGATACSPHRRWARRPTARSLIQADLVEYFLESMSPEVLVARSSVVSPRNPSALSLVGQIELHLLDAIIEILERHELLSRLVIHLQIRALPADHHRSGKPLLERPRLDLENRGNARRFHRRVRDLAAIPDVVDSF